MLILIVVGILIVKFVIVIIFEIGRGINDLVIGNEIVENESEKENEIVIMMIGSVGEGMSGCFFCGLYFVNFYGWNVFFVGFVIVIEIVREKDCILMRVESECLVLLGWE